MRHTQNDSENECRSHSPFVEMSCKTEKEGVVVSASQRNDYDVIMELVHLHIEAARRANRDVTEDEIADLFVKYYDLLDETKRGIR